MKKSHFIILGFVLLCLLVAWGINMDIISLSKKTAPQVSQLAQDGNACEDIAEKSVAHMVAVVEFQKLEIIGRKARVMRHCMDDRTYIQNPAWTAYAKPVAEKVALENNISFDEAFENLRRQHMVIFNITANQPLYWVTKKP